MIATLAAAPRGLSPTEILFLAIGGVLTVALVALFVAIVIMVRRDERAHAPDPDADGASSSSPSSANDARGRGAQP